MIRYISKWYQDVIKTPRPDVEEASQQVRDAVEELNKAIQHLQSIEGLSLGLKANDYSSHQFYINSSSGYKFRFTVDYISENHRRSF